MLLFQHLHECVDKSLMIMLCKSRTNILTLSSRCAKPHFQSYTCIYLSTPAICRCCHLYFLFYIYLVLFLISLNYLKLYHPLNRKKLIIQCGITPLILCLLTRKVVPVICMRYRRLFISLLLSTSLAFSLLFILLFNFSTVLCLYWCTTHLK